MTKEDIMKTYIFVYERRIGFYDGDRRVITEKEPFNFTVEAETRKEAYSKYKEFVQEEEETNYRFENMKNRHNCPFEYYTLLNLIEL